MRKLSYEEIKEYIEGEEGCQCKLVTTKKEFDIEKTKQNKSNTKIKVRILCGECRKEIFKTSLNSFKNNNKRHCDKCGSKNVLVIQPKTQLQFEKEVFDLYKNEYTILGEYINTSTKIKVRHNCNDCNNYIFETRPSDFLKDHKCPKCQHRSYKKTTSEFKQEIYNLVKDEYIVLGEYKNNNTKILMKHNCDKCGNYEWRISPNNFLRGNRCPVCNESKGEQAIRCYCERNNIYFKSQYAFNDLLSDLGNPLRFDFAIFKNEENAQLKCLIEYDGEFHYFPIISKNQLATQKHHDKRKDNYCKDNNIKLIRIPYWEKDSIKNILSKELYDYNKDKAEITDQLKTSSRSRKNI